MRGIIGVAIAGAVIAGCRGRGADGKAGASTATGTGASTSRSTAFGASTSTATGTATGAATGAGTGAGVREGAGSSLGAAPCRIIGLSGQAAGDAGALALQGDVPRGWIGLSEGGHLVGKDPRTARETTFDGPGRLRDCVGSAEEAWVAEGAFESSAGAGEAPGAEQWVVTPHAVVRYASAKVRLRVRPTGTTVTMVAGVAFAWPPAAHPSDAGALEEGWQRLGAGSTQVGPTGGTGDAVARCADLARRTQDLTAALFFGDGGAPTGTTVTDQVTTRRLARAACAIAHLRVETEAPSAAAHGGPLGAGAPNDKLGAALEQADVAWRSLPTPTAAKAPGRADGRADGTP